MQSTEDNPLGGLYLAPDETSMFIDEPDFKDAMQFKKEILETKDFYDVKTVFGKYSANELKHILNYINSPSLDLIHRCILATNIDYLFQQACKTTDDVHLIKFLLDRGADIHVTEDKAIVWVAKNGSVEILRFLLSNGLDVNLHYDNAVYYAVQGGHLEVLRLLLVHMPAEFMKESSHHAVVDVIDKGDLDMVRLYAEFNVISHNIVAAIRTALCRGRLDILTYLVETFGIFDMKAEYNIEKACERGHLHTVKYLADKGVNVKNLKVDINQVVRYGHVEMLQFLISVGYATGMNSTVVEQAAISDSLPMMQLLLQLGADLNANHHAALCTASHRGNLTLVKFLLEYGMPCTVEQDQIRITCAAAHGGHLEVLKLLIARKFTVQTRMESVLITAVNNNRTEVVQFLVDHPDKIVTFRPGDIIMNAINNSHFSLTKYLANRFKDCEFENWPVKRLMELGQRDLAKFFIMNNICKVYLDVDDTPRPDCSLLEYIDKADALDMARYLYEPLVLNSTINKHNNRKNNKRKNSTESIPTQPIPIPAQLNITTLAGVTSLNNITVSSSTWDTYNASIAATITPDTATYGKQILVNGVPRRYDTYTETRIKAFLNDGLDHAVLENNLDLVKLLVSYGADVTCRNNVFIKHAAWRYIDNSDVVKFLLENGADIDEALDAAISNKKVGLIKFLMENGADIHADEGRHIVYILGCRNKNLLEFYNSIPKTEERVKKDEAIMREIYKPYTLHSDNLNDPDGWF